MLPVIHVVREPPIWAVQPPVRLVPQPQLPQDAHQRQAQLDKGLQRQAAQAAQPKGQQLPAARAEAAPGCQALHVVGVGGDGPPQAPHLQGRGKGWEDGGKTAAGGRAEQTAGTAVRHPRCAAAALTMKKQPGTMCPSNPPWK